MGRTKVGRDAAKAFWHGKNFTRGNTRVRVHGDKVVTLSLHGNVIAERIIGRDYALISLSGWNTVTTRERLNAVVGRLGVTVFQHDWIPYLSVKGVKQAMSSNEWYTVHVYG